MAIDDIEKISIPDNWNNQIKKWIADNGDSWWNPIEQYLLKYRDNKPNLRGNRNGNMNWNRERCYELIFFYHNHNQTSQDISRWWAMRDYCCPKTKRNGFADGEIGRMRRAGINLRGEVQPRRKTIKQTSIPAARHISSRFSLRRQIMERRQERVAKSGGSFDSLSREARGLPAEHLAQQQHPDHPTGVTYDAAHRMKHGRTSIFAENEQKIIGSYKKFNDLVIGLNKLPEAFPISDYHTMSIREREMVHLQLMKLLPRLRALVENIQNLPQPDKTVPFQMPNEVDLKILKS
jgi:hypothetical protein